MLREMVMMGLLAGAALAVPLLEDTAAKAQMSAGALVDEKGRARLPAGFREWVFLGAPLTPDGLNGGAAGFPEFHHVYVEPGAFAAYRQTGEFPDGTVIVKELVRLQAAQYDDGSRDEASGRGFFAGEFNGIDMMIKNPAATQTNGWDFYNFGHHAPPYAELAEAAPNDACAFCHTANATHDMVFTTFYPILERP